MTQQIPTKKYGDILELEYTRDPTHIDKKILEPIALFFTEFKYDTDNIEQFIVNRVKKRNKLSMNSGNLSGLVADSYVEKVLSEFSKKNENFTKSQYGRGRIHELDNGHTIEITQLGNMHFFDENRIQIAEIDNVYEIHENGNITPIIFEVSLGNVKESDIKRRGETLCMLYENHPLLSIIQPENRSNSKLCVLEDDIRRMKIPGRKGIENTAKILEVIIEKYKFPKGKI